MNCIDEEIEHFEYFTNMILHFSEKLKYCLWKSFVKFPLIANIVFYLNELKII